jgi:YaiO family outer membrane protein
MSVRGSLIVALVALVVFVSAPAVAQEDVLVRARRAAESGDRAAALAMLETRLAEAPRDVDARLIYGLVLSWEGRYDEARAALQQVLTQTPTYMDARIALMNVEYWAGRSTEARALADQVLAHDPGNTTARAVRERLAAAARPWWVHTSYSLDSFNDDRKAWQEVSVSLVRRTPIGSVILRGTDATRFDLTDQLIEVEFYPRFRPGTYAFVGVGYAPDPTLYPPYRVAFDLYQSIGHGFEVSGGARQLGFDRSTQIYVATLSKYIGNWMLTGKVYRVPAKNDLDSTSFYGGFRRYFGADGSSYAGVTYGHGFSNEEVRDIADLTTIHSDGLRGEMDWLVRSRLRVFASGGTSQQERANRSTLWQTSLTTGFSFQF